MKSKVTSANAAEANARKMARCQLRSCQCCELCRHLWLGGDAQATEAAVGSAGGLRLVASFVARVPSKPNRLNQPQPASTARSELSHDFHSHSSHSTRQMRGKRRRVNSFFSRDCSGGTVPSVRRCYEWRAAETRSWIPDERDRSSSSSSSKRWCFYLAFGV